MKYLERTIIKQMFIVLIKNVKHHCLKYKFNLLIPQQTNIFGSLYNSTFNLLLSTLYHSAETTRTEIFRWATSFCSAHNFTSFHLTQNIKLTIVNTSFAAPPSISYHWWVQAAFNVNWRQARRPAGRIPTFLHSSSLILEVLFDLAQNRR